MASVFEEYAIEGYLNLGFSETQVLACIGAVRTYRRIYRSALDPMKVAELMIARRLEAELSKTRIFELYLNVIEWGDGIYGCEAAVAYFQARDVARLAAQISADYQDRPVHLIGMGVFAVAYGIDGLTGARRATGVWAMLGMLAVCGGLALSWFKDTPAGPSIVVTAAALFLLSFVLPRRGV